MSGTPADLDARYGRTPGRRRAGRAWAVAVAAVVAVVVIAWVVWVGLFTPASSLETRNVGFDAPTDRSIDIRYEVSAEPGTPVTCAIQALNHEYAIVGWKVVDLPASDQRTRQFATTLRTSEQAVTGLIYRCWLT